MKEKNQIAILKMVARDFKDHSYSSIIYRDESGKQILKIERDFINLTEICYTAGDILNMSIKNDGNVFEAILRDFRKKSSEQTEERLGKLVKEIEDLPDQI